MRLLRRLSNRQKLAAGLIAVVMLGAGTVAWAYFTSHGSGTATATVATLAEPTNVVVSQPNPSVATVHVTWTGITSPSGNPADVTYFVQRFLGASPSNACGTTSTSGVAASPCDDTSVAPGTYTYTVTAIFRSFTATSAPSSAITVATDSTPPNAPVIVSPSTSGANSGTFSNGVFNASTWGSGCTSPATICGTASDNAGGSGVQKTQLEIVGTGGTNNGKYWTGSAWVSGTPQYFDAVGTTAWSYQLVIPADGTYTLQAQTFDNAGNHTANTIESITIDNTNPTAGAPGVAAAVTFSSSPVFVDNEPVSLTDTATDTGGTGVRSVAYFFCVGSSGTCTGGTQIGSSSSASTWPVTWSSLPADGPYRVVAVATDNAGNVSASSTAIAVSVDTTPPSVSRPIVNGNS